jgi:glycosyltransferase involved in cell wall biosynthesis/SAM-dependent methyltransferase
MRHEPLVSAIMIFHQAERFMDEAIASVCAQTWRNWELLLVDDGSTDGSAAIARRWAERHPDRIRCFEHPGRQNLGMSASRNVGVGHARGDYVAFLDADDVWLPHKLAMQVGILEAHPDVAMVYGPSEYWYGWSGRPEDARRDHYGEVGLAPDTIVEPPGLLTMALENEGGTMPGICSLLVRREAFAQIGAFEKEFRGAYEDQVFLAKMFLQTRIFVTGTCSDRYRQHDGSCCATALRTGLYHPELPHPARETYLAWLRGYLAHEGVIDPSLLAALGRNLLPYDHPLLYGSKMRLRYAGRLTRRGLVRALESVLPAPLYRALRRRWEGGQWVPPVGLVRFGSFRRRAPIGRARGAERGTTIDRHYVREFLARHADDLQGDVLELGAHDLFRDARAHGVTGHTTLPLDDTTRFRLSQLPEGRFDCVVASHVLDRVYDVRPFVKALHRVLKPGGVLLATLPGVGNVGPDTVHDSYWSFTPLAAQTLFEETFPSLKLAVEPCGNVLVATASLHGLAAEELRARELEYRDATYAVVVGVRAVKPTPEWTATIVGRWQYGNAAPFPYGDDVTYRKGLAFLDGHGTIEDWGAGTGYARRFVTQSTYRALDGSPSLDVDRVVDLRTYHSDADCIFMRHVLEHNPDWRRILENALRSFRRRMVLVVFTPFAAETHEIASWHGIPDLAFRKEDLVAHFGGLAWREETVDSNTEYLREHVFYLERRALRQSA